jgi:hypothetical protein
MTPTESGPSKPPQKLFLSPYEQVWKATQFSVKYPIAINNMDSGMLETEWIKSVDGFRPPVIESEPDSGMRYKIMVQAVRGQIDGKSSVKVTVRKKIEKLKNFFSDPEALQSDGLEEQVILYRIEREIAIEDGIKKSLR